MSDHFTPLARSLPASIPFVGPEALERRLGRPFQARLGANESVFGPSPLAIEAMRESAGRSWMYGDPEHFELREALAAHLGTPVPTIAVGEGIDGLLGHLVRLACAPGDLVVTSLGAYPTFNYHVAGHGGRLDFVPYRDDREDIDALIERARAVRPKLLYFANPDNPTGSVHDARAVERLIESVPGETILVLDEAYGDMAPAALPAIGLVRPNLLRFRTFSKAYGLAGARVGFAVGHPDLVAGFDRVRNHFGLSRVSQAGALAALKDPGHLDAVLGRIAAARERIAAIAEKAGLRPLPSATNFVAIDCGGDGARARAILEGVIARGVFIRMPGVAPLDRMIRVTAGMPGDLDLFEAALHGALREVGAAT
ncbi:pyridoxal phosphate-dependent aminotransferase [Aurantimonas sp. Leaf443]|uniref:pyridoxal phosphate-dependent aminotransferase n=1 Tax=Aurantimonas sp. Leaf443 TaxID=1736378 RepID=UPI0006F4830B|nr:pyridoxal phosphate-dependent aminotransferase [Aurantimonas sp. Leaf443]KQT88272.1 histidinol-phosphate aminotransferase [Aurantimonas sp. Leaf443]